MATGGSAKPQLAVEVFEDDDESVCSFPGQSQEEICAVESGDPRGLFLRDLGAFVPVHGSGQAQFTDELVG